MYKISGGHFFDQSIRDDDELDFDPSNTSAANDTERKNPSDNTGEEKLQQQSLEAPEEVITTDTANSIATANNNEV